MRPIAALLVGLLAGCAAGPDYHAPRTPVPAAFIATSNSPALSSATVDPSRWWHSFNDPQLDSLVDTAASANFDAGIALLHLQQARAAQAADSSAALPTLAASAAGGRGTGSDLTRAGAAPALRETDNKGDLSQIRQVAGFAASWELDVFGGYRRAIEAGRADVGAAKAARDAVLISVIADVVRNYVQLRGLQLRLGICLDNIKAATESRDLQQARFDRGISNELDLQLANRELATLRAEVPLIRSTINSRVDSIALLLGEYPENIAARLQTPGALPQAPAAIATGLPVDLLRRRPDIREAERRLAGATARIGVATSSLFPHVSLVGGLGAQSDSIGAQGTHIWGFGPAVYWPLLDFGALDAHVQVADLEARARLLEYRKTVVAAVADADGAVGDFSAQRERLDDLAAALTASGRAVELAQQRYERGLTDFLNVVDAEKQQFTLRDEYIVSEQQTAETFIRVCLALGGGWESYGDLPPIRRPEPAVIAAFHRVFEPAPEVH